MAGRARESPTLTRAGILVVVSIHAVGEGSTSGRHGQRWRAAMAPHAHLSGCQIPHRLRRTWAISARTMAGG